MGKEAGAGRYSKKHFPLWATGRSSAGDLRAAAESTYSLIIPPTGEGAGVFIL